MSGWCRDYGPRKYVETKPAVSSDPHKNDETKPQMRDLGKVCRLCQVDRPTWPTRKNDETKPLRPTHVKATKRSHKCEIWVMFVDYAK